ARIARCLRSNGLLSSELTGPQLRAEIDRISCYFTGQVNLAKLPEYFAQYLWLPRVQSSKVIQTAIREGLLGKHYEAGEQGRPRLTISNAEVPGNRRFRGVVSLDPADLAGDANRLKTDLVDLLAQAKASDVRLVLHIDALLQRPTESQMRAIIDSCDQMGFSARSIADD
ncbi:MAG TPA: hypothetical protein VGS41_08035, partial [Chthonomonadales bacterium]|nr:hypothetical protein [Chthonomonadales bacterium]